MREAVIHALLVGSGGFVGAVARFGLTGLLQRQAVAMPVFPYGTLAVNLLGCFLIGVLAGLAESRQLIGPELRMFTFVGLLGGFTTFSTFGYETLTLLQDAGYLRAAANISVHLLAGLALVWFGYSLATSQ